MTGFYLSVATSRLAEELRRLRAHLGTLDREQRANQFVGTDYARLRLEQVADERKATEAEIAEPESLTDEQIVQRFNPVKEQPDGIPTAELAGRGARLPRQVVVHRDPPPSHRIGGDPSPAPSG